MASAKLLKVSSPNISADSNSLMLSVIVLRCSGGAAWCFVMIYSRTVQFHLFK